MGRMTRLVGGAKAKHGKNKIHYLIFVKWVGIVQTPNPFWISMIIRAGEIPG
jgi:hypothetical protein